jgi:hypothetical protein
MVMNGTSLYITGELLGHRTYILSLKKAVNDVWGKKI